MDRTSPLMDLMEIDTPRGWWLLAKQNWRRPIMVFRLWIIARKAKRAVRSATKIMGKTICGD